jgi:hypothetical protein
MARLRHDKDYLSADDESDGTTDNESDSLFDEGDDDTSDTDNIEILSNESDSNTDDEAYLSDDKGPQPPEYYLAEAASLDVKRLRQRRYSPKTQERLDWVKDHWHK